MSEELIEDILANVDTTNIDNKNLTNIDNGETDPTKTKTETSTDKKIEFDETKLSSTKTDIDPSKSKPTIEELATKIGWNSEYEGEDKIDATTYILKSREIQDTIKDHNKNLKTQVANLQGSVDALREHNERVHKAEVKHLQSKITELQKQKRAAVETADVKKVDEIDTQIDNIKKDLSETTPKKTQESNPIFDDWVKDNQWYLTDDEMAAYADTIGNQYAGAPLDRVYKIVRQKVAEVFPEKFENKSSQETRTEQNKPIGPTSPVETSKTKSSSQTFTEANLTPEQVSIMKQFVQGGIMTKEQYIKDIAKMQED